MVPPFEHDGLAVACGAPVPSITLTFVSATTESRPDERADGGAGLLGESAARRYGELQDWDWGLAGMH
jgi:hypothetical protein